MPIELSLYFSNNIGHRATLSEIAARIAFAGLGLPVSLGAALRSAYATEQTWITTSASQKDRWETKSHAEPFFLPLRWRCGQRVTVACQSTSATELGTFPTFLR